MIKQSPSVVYRINENDNIDFVNDAWSRFAIENDAERLSDGVIGTSLWDHIVGVDVTQVYRDLLWRVRTKMVSARFPFRCDSPEYYRRMELVVIPLEKERVEFHAILGSEGPHGQTIELLRHSHSVELESFMPICAWCKAVIIDGIWQPLEEAIKSTACLLQEPFPRLTHSICNVCLAEYARLAP